MNKKRMSERKSQLRLNIQDFCMALPQNSDPVVGYLLTILEWQASLDVQTNSILHKAFVNQIDQLKCKLKMELKLSKNKIQGFDTHNTNIAKFIGEFHKLKQVFAYCLILSKKKSELCEEVQKFNQYIQMPTNLTEQLESYLNEPIIFETIFHNYLRIYNINILTADLISFLYAENQQKALMSAFNDEVQQNVKWSNPDIQLLKSQKIIFKQLTDMNKKYVDLAERLKNSYISYLCNDPLGIQQSNNVNAQQELKGEQEHNLKEKVKRLEKILSKIKKQPRLYSNQRSLTITLESEPICNFNVLGVKSDSMEGDKVLEENKQFFLDTLHGKSWTQTSIGDQQFTFMRQKIIKTETLFFLNRILSAMNVISHIYNQLDIEVRDSYEFEFKNLRKLIGSEFINQQIYDCKLCKSVYRNSFISVDSCTMSYNVVDMQNIKILYPSTVNYFYGFLKNMLSISFSDKEGLLQILEAKSEYTQSLAETLINMFQIIKTKQFSCYKLLREYIQVLRKSSSWNNLSNKKFEEILKEVSKQKEKIGIISQIIYEFDHNYSIKEPLEQLIRIQFDGLTKNCVTTFQLYKKILYEIIQIRNGLKLDHYYSVNQIHQKFSLLPTDLVASGDQKTKHQDLYFEDIIHQICTASHSNLYLPKLFFLLDLQLKFKRIVFKLELCWSSNREVMFDRKIQAFKDFIDVNCIPIFEIVNQCHSMVALLQKIEQIQKQIELFNKEVARFHLIEKIVGIIGNHEGSNQISSVRQHVSRLALERLHELNALVSIFNPIQSHYSSNRSLFLDALFQNIETFSSIRLDEIKNFDPIYTKQKQKLATIIVILNRIPSRNSAEDYMNFIHLFYNKKINSDLYQLKQNESMQRHYEQWLTTDNLELLIKFNEDLLVISILRTLRQMEAESLEGLEDFKQLQKLMRKFDLSKIFLNLSNIQDIGFWRSQFGIMTKYHQIYQLMYHFDCFNSRVFGTQGKRAHYKNKKLLNLLDHRLDFSYEPSDFIAKLFYIFQITPFTRMKLQRNIQKLQSQILESESLHHHTLQYHEKLKKKIYDMFCSQIQKMLHKTGLNDEINIKFDTSKSPSYHIDSLRKVMLNAVSNEYINGTDSRQQQYGKFRQIEMFKEKKGYQLPIIEQKQNKDYKIGTKKHIERNKKAIISPHKLQQEKTRPLEELRRKFKIEMLKKSLQIRKQISKLQLCQNKIRDEIVWQTSKLQYSVVERINQFITLSNVDKQQSYINFKHTVNLETIKGIENVIDEQTQMFMEKKNAPVEPQPDTFLTEVQGNEKKDQQKVDKKQSLLDTNVESILLHMKKIRIFSAWKKTMKKADLIKKQWCNFNANVQNILNNDKVLESLIEIEEDRNNYLRQNVTCQIIKQENMRINEKIQELKIDNLERKVKNYRENLLRK